MSFSECNLFYLRMKMREKELVQAMDQIGNNGSEYFHNVDDQPYYEAHEQERNNYRVKCFTYPWDWVIKPWPNSEIKTETQKFEDLRKIENKKRAMQNSLNECERLKSQLKK